LRRRSVSPMEDRDVAQLGTGLWNRMLIDATRSWKNPRRSEWGGERFPPTVRQTMFAAIIMPRNSGAFWDQRVSASGVLPLPRTKIAHFRCKLVTHYVELMRDRQIKGLPCKLVAPVSLLMKETWRSLLHALAHKLTQQRDRLRRGGNHRLGLQASFTGQADAQPEHRHVPDHVHVLPRGQLIAENRIVLRASKALGLLGGGLRLGLCPRTS